MLLFLSLDGAASTTFFEESSTYEEFLKLQICNKFATNTETDLAYWVDKFCQFWVDTKLVDDLMITLNQKTDESVHFWSFYDYFNFALIFCLRSQVVF